jgi:hypothetical protein
MGESSLVKNQTRRNSSLFDLHRPATGVVAHPAACTRRQTGTHRVAPSAWSHTVNASLRGAASLAGIDPMVFSNTAGDAARFCSGTAHPRRRVTDASHVAMESKRGHLERLYRRGAGIVHVHDGVQASEAIGILHLALHARQQPSPARQTSTRESPPTHSAVQHDANGIVF